MPNLYEILSKAYAHTKNHKLLWFFGFFMLEAATFDYFYAFEYHSRGGFGGIASFLVSGKRFDIFLYSLAAATVLMFLGVASRIAIIQAILTFERKEALKFHEFAKKAYAGFWRVCAVNIAADAALILIFSWLSAPVIYLFSEGLDFRGAFLAVFAILIFVPIFVSISLVNFFASCFIVVYRIKFSDSIKSSFDLLGRFWDVCLIVLAILASLYALLFIASAGALGVLNNLAYISVILLQSISALVSRDISLILSVLLVAASVFASSILNAFSNSTLALLFLKIVKDRPLTEKGENQAVEAKPAA